MKMNPYLIACVALLLLAAGPAIAQLKAPGQTQKPSPLKPAPNKAPTEKADDALAKYIQEKFKTHGGWTLCVGENMTVADIRSELAQELKSKGLGSTAPIDDVAVALWTRFPCPISPGRDELRPATAKEIEGVWMSPERSQPYRYGPKSPSQPGGPAVAIRCEIVGYYPGGELRTGLVRGADPCPFAKAADLEPARTRPRVSSWSMLRDGRLSVARTDIAGHIEEWDIFVVTTPFEVQAMEFKTGDLVSYLRREKGNDINAATEFRHLQRLP